MTDKALVYDRPVFINFAQIKTWSNLALRKYHYPPVVKAADTVFDYVGQVSDGDKARKWMFKLSNPTEYVTGEGFRYELTATGQWSLSRRSGVSLWRTSLTRQTLKDRLINTFGGLV